MSTTYINKDIHETVYTYKRFANMHYLQAMYNTIQYTNLDIVQLDKGN